MYRLRVFSGMPSFDIHSKGLMLWKSFQLWSCLAVNRFQGVFFFLVCVSGHIDLRQRGETKGDPLPFFLFLHSTCYLSHEQQFCLNLSSPHGKKKKEKSVCSHQLLTSLLFKCLVRASSNQSPAELDFHLPPPALISTSLLHYPTILPLFFLFL